MRKDRPQTMRVIEMNGAGDAGVLREAWRPLPEPGPGEVLIRVAAAGVNRPDILQRQGLYPPPKDASDLLGLEIAGEVAAVGQGATRFSKGDRVAALVNGGGYAEYCVTPEAQALPLPPALDPVEGAALPEAIFTVWHNVFERGRLKLGEWLLVHGGASGIGTTAIQMACALGCNVIATAGSPEKCAACGRLGATRAINYRNEDFVEIVKEVTGGHGADVILDMVGGPYIARNLQCAALEGRIVQIAFLKGSKVEIDFMRLMMKRLTLTGSTLRAQSAEAKAKIARAVEAMVWPHVVAGRIRPVIERRFAVAEAAGAHRHLEQGDHIGKIVLTME